MLPSAASQASARTAFPLWQRAAFFSLAYFICAEAGSFLSARTGNYVSFWLPAGLFVAVLLLNPTRDWLALALAVLPANLVFDYFHDTKPELEVILLFYLANIVQSVTGAWLVRRFVAEKPTLATVKEFVGLVGLAGVFSTILGAAIGAGTLVKFGMSHSFLQSWKVWWGSPTMAVLIFTPLILTWFPGEAARFPKISLKKAVEGALLFGGMAGLAWHLLVIGGGINSQMMPLLVFVVWAGLRFGLRGATLAVFLLAVCSSFLTTHYLKGISAAEQASGGYIFTLQVFVAVSAIVGLVPAVVLGERDRSLTQLRESEERFRNLSQAAFDGIAITENGRLVDANKQLLKMLGYERNEIIGQEVMTVVAPESRALVAEAIRTGSEATYAHQSLRKDGSRFHVEARARLIRLGDRMVRMTALRDITERKAAEQALRESEEKFSKAFRASPDGLAVSELETGRFIEVNEGCCRLYGYAREEMLGRTSFELGLWQDPADRDRLVEEFKVAGRLRNSQVRVRTRAGDIKIVLLGSEAIELGGKSCLVSALHDVTERIRAEQALRESEEKFSRAFRASPDGLGVSELETGRYIEVNEGYCELYGYAREEMLGHTSIELGIWENPQDRKRLVEGLKATGGVRSLEVRTRTRDGGVKFILLSAEAIELGGKACLVSALHDVTEQKKAEAEREQAVAREQQARIEYTLQLIAAQEAERKRIAAELHDSMGQNLLLIKNLAQIALQSQAPEQAYEQLATINHLAAQCIAEARQISRDLHPYQLDHLGLKRALEAMLEHAAQASAIRFTSKLEPVDDLFPADAAMNLYRIVQESLNNILKHSQARRVNLRLERDIHEVQLRIEDDGVGFSMENAGGQKGLGLKNISERVRMLGGKLNVDSSPGKGTRIEVTIPTAEAPGGASQFPATEFRAH